MEYSIIKSAFVKFEANYLYKSHKHNHYEIIYTAGGQCMMLINDKEVVLSVGDCIFINRNVKHNFYVNGKSGCKIQQLEIECNEEILNDEYLRLTNAPIISSCLNNINTFYKEKTFEAVQTPLIELEIKQLSLLAKAMAVTNLNENVYIPKAVKAIKEKYLSEISGAEIAAELGISERYLRKIFESDLGITPKEYIITLRMEKAKNLLINTDKKIAEIAGLTGYNTIQYFSEIFKERTGVTPREFREINKLNAR